MVDGVGPPQQVRRAGRSPVAALPGNPLLYAVLPDNLRWPRNGKGPGGAGGTQALPDRTGKSSVSSGKAGPGNYIKKVIAQLVLVQLV